MSTSFWQKNSLVTDIFFDLCLLIITFSPVSNFGDQSLTWVLVKLQIDFSFFRSGRKSAKSKMKKLEDWQWSKRHERQQRQDMMWYDKDVSSIFNVTNTHLNCSKIPRNQTSPNKNKKTHCIDARCNF